MTYTAIKLKHASYQKLLFKGCLESKLFFANDLLR